MLVLALFFCVAAVLLAHAKTALPFAHDSIVMNNYRIVGRADDVEMTIRLGLVSRATAALLREEVDALSDPRSPRYGQYLSIHQVADKFGASEATIKTVEEWARQEKVKMSISLQKDWAKLSVRTSRVPSLFPGCSSVLHYAHLGSDRRVFRCASSGEKVLLPAALDGHVRIVQGLTDFLDDVSDREALASKQKKEALAESTTSAPEFIGPRGGSEREVFVGARLVCKNGQEPSSIGACSDGVTVVSVSINATSDNGHGQSVTIPFSQCQGNRCQTHFNVVPYRRVKLTAQTRYSDGSQSETADYAPFWSPSPWATPQALYELYSVPDGAAGGVSEQNFQAVVGFEKQYVSQEDFASYFNNFGLAPPTTEIIGPNNGSVPGVEATLDFQSIAAMGRGIRTRFWSFGGSGPAHGAAYVLAWAHAVADTEDAPLVTSISYGDTEGGYYRKFGDYSYIDQMNAELAKMATRGLTVLAGSGDAGASNVGEMGNDISGTDPNCGPPLRPFFPSNSPYVVSLSASFVTQYATPFCESTWQGQPATCSTLGEAPTAISQGIPFTTGGGFGNASDSATRPPYQDQAVKDFFSRASSDELPPDNYYNKEGRAYPDLVAIGWNVPLVYAGSIVPVGGTSASGPIQAGLLSLVNEKLLLAKRPPLGAPHHLLYQLASEFPQAFNDVTVGKNNDGDLQQRGSPYPATCQYGFPSKPGYDPVTGLGSLNVEQLLFALDLA